MPSANGFTMEVDGHTVVSSWPAPFYVLLRSQGPDGPDEPVLRHCESLGDAMAYKRLHGGQILRANFEPFTR